MTKLDSRNSHRELRLIQCFHHLHCVRLLQKTYFNSKDKETLKRTLIAEELADKFIQDLFTELCDRDKYYLSNYTTFELSDEKAF